MNACDHCPCRSGVCLAIRTGHVRFCQLTDPTHPDYSEAYVGLVANGPDADAALVPLVETRAEPCLADKLKLVNACPHRSDTLKECSCTGRKRCGLGRGQFPSERWAVTLADCLRCVADPSKLNRRLNPLLPQPNHFN